MNKIIDYIVEGKHKKPIVLDAYWKTTNTSKPIVIFAHGFKGLKDWGFWHVLGQGFVDAGFVFVKFNFSHNATTPDNPLEFGDLPAFGENNYEIELDDLKTVLDWVSGDETTIPKEEINTENIALIGHSRGGGVSIVKTAEDVRIKKLITWASVDRLNWIWDGRPELVERWRKEGVLYIKNGRTKQDMPLNFQLYENYIENAERFDVQRAAATLNVPFLILHGGADPGVPVQAAENIHSWSKYSKLHIVEGANHVFGGSHPYTKTDLPDVAAELLRSSVDFLKG